MIVTINTTTNQMYLTLPITANVAYIDTHTHTVCANRAIQTTTVSTKD